MRGLGRWTGFFVLFFLAAAPVLAQENEPSPADTTTGWVFRWLNFAIIVGLIVYAFRKASPHFRERREEILERIEEGTRAREAAEQRRLEAEEKLKGLDQEIEQIRAAAKKATEAEGLRLRALSKEEAEKIERMAQAEIAATERAARMELKSLGARLAVERAESLLREELTPKAEAALFRGFVQEIERSAN